MNTADITVRRILIPLPDYDYDPAVSSTQWKVCVDHGWKFIFSTENGNIAAADYCLLMGPVCGPLGGKGIQGNGSGPSFPAANPLPRNRSSTI